MFRCDSKRKQFVSIFFSMNFAHVIWKTLQFYECYLFIILAILYLLTENFTGGFTFNCSLREKHILLPEIRLYLIRIANLSLVQ